MKYTLRCNEDGVTETIDASHMDAAKERAEAWMRDGEWGTDGATVGVTVEFRGPPRLKINDGDIEVHTTAGWGYVTPDDAEGTASAYWQPRGATDLTDLAIDVAPLAAIAALLAAVPTDAEADELLTEEYLEVEIEPDHSGKIADATRGCETCGTEPDDHDWTSDGEGGCRENPGVWGHGGTAMSFDSHCRKCGLHRHEHSTGIQRNPDDHDTVEYEMLDDETIAAHRANGDMDEAVEQEA